MNLIRIVIVSLLLISFIGCASMNTPSSSLIETKPVIKIGASGERPKDHIIFIPANQKFPVEFAIKGNGKF